LKFLLTGIRRNVKDRLEFQGRNQVKVILTNLISKCDYYLNEFDRKKLTLSNIVFTNVESNKTNQNEDDEAMSFIENVANMSTLDSTINSSFLPDL
jgi:hypothetical protein